MTEYGPTEIVSGGPPPIGMVPVDVSGVERYRSALVGAFDFLGFRHVMQTADDLWRLVAHVKLVADLIRVVAEARSLFTVDGAEPSGRPFVLNVSDTILVVSPSSEPPDTLQFLWNTHQVLFHSIQAGMPLRGAVTVGDVLVSRERRLFLGPAVLEALALERSQEWSGACVSSMLLDRIEAAGIMERVYPLIVPYEIPWKAERPDAGSDYAVNWIADAMSYIAPSFLETKFPDDGRTDDERVRAKIENTRRFLEHVDEIRKSDRSFELPDNRRLLVRPGEQIRVVNTDEIPSD